MDIAKYLKPYSEHQIKNWKGSKKIVVYSDEAQLHEFVKAARENRINGKKLYFGIILDSVAERVKKEHNIDIKEHNCTIRADEVKKIFKSHGDELTESRRGQTLAAVVSRKHLDIYTQTMYVAIKNRSLATAIDEQASINTSETTSGTASKSSIPQNSEKSTPTYSISEDSQGRELSNEQVEYFKDSQVRDDKGRLQVMYHFLILPRFLHKDVEQMDL